MRVLLAAGLVLLAGCAQPETQAPAGRLAWSFVDTDGVERNATQAEGAPAVLFFMATWCSDCRTKAAWLDDVHHDYQEHGVRMYSVSTSPSTDSDAALEAWRDEHDHPWPHGRDANGSMRSTFRIQSQSTLVVLDASGSEAARLSYGQNAQADLRKALDAILGA